MKYLFYILLLFSFPVFSTTYYISPADSGGNDGNAGTYASPWFRMDYATGQLSPGDTLFILDGTYHYDDRITLTAAENGTYANRIYYWGYPPDVAAGRKPVFDFATFDEEPANGNTYAIALYIGNGAGFFDFKDFDIINVFQHDIYTEVTAVSTAGGHNLRFENISVSNCRGRGFFHNTLIGYYGVEYDTTLFINCDAYEMSDSLQYTAGASPGNQADGFKTYGEKGAYIVYRGCRAWNCSDDGFDCTNTNIIIFDSCWSFRNGWILQAGGDGNGFKTGGVLDSVGYVLRIITHCIAAFNDKTGYFLLEYEDYHRTPARIYNNISYYNDGSGFSISNNVVHPTVRGQWRNNIAYRNTVYPFQNAYQQYTESHNNWDRVNGYPGYEWTDTVTVTDADFVYIDSVGGLNQLMGARGVDGSLPNITFLTLASTSDLIDAGCPADIYTEIDTFPYYDFAYIGDDPDMGWDEYGEPEPAELGTVINVSQTPSVYTASVSGNANDDGGGTVSDKGICWSTSENPTTSGNHYSAGAGTGAFNTTIKQLAKSTTYHVRSYITNEAGTAYSSDATFTTLDRSISTSGGKVIKYNGIIIRVE